MIWWALDIAQVSHSFVAGPWPFDIEISFVLSARCWITLGPQCPSQWCYVSGDAVVFRSINDFVENAEVCGNRLCSIVQRPL